MQSFINLLDALAGSDTDTCLNMEAVTGCQLRILPEL